MATGNAMSSYLEAALLNWIKGTTFPVSPANLYVALYTVAPNDANASGTEVVGNNYARVAIASSAWSVITDSGAGTGASISNSGLVSFAAPSASWGTVVAFALYDALTNGNEIVWAALNANKFINPGDPVQFAAGTLQVVFD